MGRPSAGCALLLTAPPIGRQPLLLGHWPHTTTTAAIATTTTTTTSGHLLSNTKSSPIPTTCFLFGVGAQPQGSTAIVCSPKAAAEAAAAAHTHTQKSYPHPRHGSSSNGGMSPSLSGVKFEEGSSSEAAGSILGLAGLQGGGGRSCGDGRLDEESARTGQERDAMEQILAKAGHWSVGAPCGCISVCAKSIRAGFADKVVNGCLDRKGSCTASCTCFRCVFEVSRWLGRPGSATARAMPCRKHQSLPQAVQGEPGWQRCVLRTSIFGWSGGETSGVGASGGSRFTAFWVRRSNSGSSLVDFCVSGALASCRCGQSGERLDHFGGPIFDDSGHMRQAGVGLHQARATSTTLWRACSSSRRVGQARVQSRPNWPFRQFLPFVVLACVVFVLLVLPCLVILWRSGR